MLKTQLRAGHGASTQARGRPFGDVIIWAMLVAAASAHAAVPTYLCERLPGDAAVKPTAINSTGAVAGGVFPPDRDPELIAYTWTKKLKPTRLVRRHGASLANDINDSGQVTGCFVTPEYREKATVWLDGVETRLGGLAGPKGDACAYGINNAGLVVGASWTSTGVWHATIWDHGAVIDLADAGDDQSSRAFHVNESGLVVGYRGVESEHTHAVSWSEGRMTDLGVLEGGTMALATASNRDGTIVGESETGLGQTAPRSAVVWRQGKISELGQLVGGAGGRASAINDAGTIVGTSEDHHLNLTAVAWYDASGEAIDLNTRLAGSGCTAADGSAVRLQSATGINRRGQIVVVGVTKTASNFPAMGFRLTPQ